MYSGNINNAAIASQYAIPENMLIDRYDGNVKLYFLGSILYTELIYKVDATLSIIVYPLYDIYV